jgi:hypothetical protein
MQLVFCRDCGSAHPECGALATTDRALVNSLSRCALDSQACDRRHIGNESRREFWQSLFRPYLT